MAGKNRASDFVAGMALLFAVHFAPRPWRRREATRSRASREPVHVAAWPAGKKVAVSFALFVEEFGFGQGPVFRPDLATRNPDLVNEAFRQYAIDWGIPRVGRLFKELDVPLTIVLNAEFPAAHTRRCGRSSAPTQPNAPIVAHGMNNTSHMLPLGRGLAEQKAYIRRTLDLIAATTGVRPTGWSSPSVYSNGDTMQAMAAEGITYNLDQMDSDIISRLKTPDGALVLLPYPAVTVDMGQYLARMKTPDGDRDAVAGLRVGACQLRPAPIRRARQRRWSSESIPSSSARPTGRPPCGAFSRASRRTTRSG